MEDYSKLTTVLLKLRKQLNYAKLEALIKELKEANRNTNFKDPEWSLEEYEEFFYPALVHIAFDLQCASHAIDQSLKILESHRKRNELLAKKKDINYINAKLKELGLELNTPPPRF